jgi:hypothetical protein
MNTWMLDVEIPSLELGDGFIDIEIDFLNLMPGRYSVSLFLGAVGPLFQDLLDHCGIIDVEPSDFYNSGKGIESRFGIVFFPFKVALPGQDHALALSHRSKETVPAK